MNLFQRLKIWKELKLLENRAREQPSPSTLIDLAQVYINLGMHDRTLQVAEEGLALFPDSDELRKLKKFSKKAQINDRIKVLRTKINKVPTAPLYQELAHLYLDMGDHGAVHGTCEECIRRFPDNTQIHLILARAHLTGFYRDLRAREGLDALHSLTRVIELDPENAKARRLLMDLLYRIGAIAAAKEQLDVIDRLQPGERENHDMRKRLEGMASVGENPEILLHNVETNGRLANVPVTRQRQSSPRSIDEGIGRIRDSLGQIAEIHGVHKAAYIKGSKALVKGEIRDGNDGFLRVVRICSKAARRFARRLDIGTFNKGILRGDFGWVCICSFGEVIAAVQCESQEIAARVLVELQELVAGSLFMTVGGKA